jgi:hypothetical protein
MVAASAVDAGGLQGLQVAWGVLALHCPGSTWVLGPFLLLWVNPRVPWGRLGSLSVHALGR